MFPRLPSRRFVLTTALGLTLSGLGLGCAGGGISIPSAPPVSSGPTTPDLAAVPEWALASTAGNKESEFGIGSGASLEEATRYALRDVASRLSVSIESQLKDTYSETNGTSVESLEQVIETRVTGTRFTGWERTRSAEGGGVFWSEVRIDRRRLARDSMSELRSLADGVDLQLEGARGSALRRLIALEGTAGDRERASNLITLISVLDNEFDRDDWEARQDEWRRIDEAARRALVFEVRADRDSREIARWVESRLVAERLRTRTGSCISLDAICIDIRSEFTEADVASRHVAKVRSYLAILEPGGSVVRETDVVGRGDSKSGRDRARRNALDDLRRRLGSVVVLDGLIEP